MLKKINPNWNKSVISITILLSVVLSIFVLISPDSTSNMLSNTYGYLSNMFESIFIYGTFGLLIFLLILAFSKYGSFEVKLLNKPTYSMLSWCSMLFAAGIGATILYWATIEWAEYYNILKNNSSFNTSEAMLYSRAYPLFHWGFSAWAIYCLPVVAFGVAMTLNPNSNLTFSGILKPKNYYYKFLLDVLFIGAIICGAGVGLGLSFPLISSVISEVLVIERTIGLDIFTIVVCSTIFGISAYIGVQNGIRRLSNINIILVLLFLLIIIALGPTQYIISNSSETLSFLMKNYVQMSLTTGTEISIDWSVFYLAWWLALAPMIGTFIVNISNNKSLRQIILGTILVGSFGCMFCMLVLSNLSIHLYETGIINSPNIMESNLMPREELVVKTISSLNYSYILLLAFSVILIIFLCTTYDSATYVLASASMKNSSIESSKSLRVIFAILLVIQPTLLMYLNGVDSFKWIMVIFSIPLLFIYLLLIHSIIKNVYSTKRA